MFWFIISLVLLALSVFSLIYFIKSRRALKEMRASKAVKPERGYGYDRLDNDEKDQKFEMVTSGIIFVVAFFIGFGILGLDSVTVVPSRNVGVPVTFGAVGDPLAPGPHLVEPWTDVTKVDATTQNINRNADESQWSNGVCTAVLVRLASGANACADITAQWNVSQDSKTASNLWTQYRGNTEDTDKTNDNFITNLTNNVVDREIQRAMNAAFATYNPIVVGNDNQAVNTPLDLATYSKTVLNDLKSSITSGIDTTELLVSHVHFDKVTQDKINALAQAKADTQIAIQKKLTAQAQKEANDLLASSSSNDPGVQFQNCLNLLRDLAANGQLAGLPINALQCQAGGANGATVIVDSTKK